MEKMEWLPIESAPKDGTWVLTIAAPFTIPSVLHFSEDDAWEDDFFSSKRAAKFGCAEVQLAEPTHWMPLPAPPAPPAPPSRENG